MALRRDKWCGKRVPEGEEAVRLKIGWGFMWGARWEQVTRRAKASGEETEETQKWGGCRSTGIGRGWNFAFMRHTRAEKVESGVGSGPQ